MRHAHHVRQLTDCLRIEVFDSCRSKFHKNSLGTQFDPLLNMILASFKYLSNRLKRGDEERGRREVWEFCSGHSYETPPEKLRHGSDKPR